MIAITLVRDTPDLVAAMRGMLPGVRVCDNGSKEPVDDAWMRIPENKYFSGGFNQAMQAIRNEGKYQWVWMLNSDVSGVSQDMLSGLVFMAKQMNASVVSPRVPSSSWGQMHPGAFLSQSLFVDWVAPVVNVAWFVHNGGFDEQFLGWGADVDLCYRTQQDRKIVTGHYSIHHPYGATSRRCNDYAMYQHRETQRLLFEKHGIDIVRFAPGYFVA